VGFVGERRPVRKRPAEPEVVPEPDVLDTGGPWGACGGDVERNAIGLIPCYLSQARDGVKEKRLLP